MGWPEIQTAILDAISLASGVDRSRVRLAGQARPSNRLLVADVDFELVQVDWEPRGFSTFDGGLQQVLRVDMEIVARITLWSLTHDAAANAYAATYRTLRRCHMSVVADRLAQEHLVLRTCERAVPTQFRFDDHVETAVQFSWILAERSDELEGPEIPRQYFDRIAGDALDPDAVAAPAADPGAEQRAAIAPALPPAPLRDLDWRSLWLGGALDLIGGRALAGAGVVHDQAAADLPALLDRASAVGPGTGAICADQDAGQLRNGLVIAALLRAPAEGDGEVLARGADWSLRLAADVWVLEVAGSDVGTAPATGGWDLLVLGAAGGELGVWREGGASTSAGAPPVSSQTALALGSASTPEGVLCALLGELAGDDPAQARADVAAALGVS